MLFPMKYYMHGIILITCATIGDTTWYLIATFVKYVEIFGYYAELTTYK